MGADVIECVSRFALLLMFFLFGVVSASAAYLVFTVGCYKLVDIMKASAAHVLVWCWAWQPEMHCSVFLFSALHYTAQYSALHSPALHYTAQYTALHSLALHYTAPYTIQWRARVEAAGAEAPPFGRGWSSWKLKCLVLNQRSFLFFLLMACSHWPSALTCFHCTPHTAMTLHLLVHVSLSFMQWIF